MPFQKGHKLNIGNKWCVGRKPWNKGIKYSAKMKARLNLSGLNLTGFHGKHTEQTKKLLSEQRRGKKWSEAQRINIIKALPRGENHWKWKKDRTTLSRVTKQGERRTSAYFYWRKQVWLRDGFKCKINNQDCVGRIEAHHILGWKEHPNLRYDVSNGITLCHFHHPYKKEDEKRLSPYFKSLVAVSDE